MLLPCSRHVFAGAHAGAGWTRWLESTEAQRLGSHRFCFTMHAIAAARADGGLETEAGEAGWRCAALRCGPAWRYTHERLRPGVRRRCPAATFPGRGKSRAPAGVQWQGQRHMSDVLGRRGARREHGAPAQCAGSALFLFSPGATQRTIKARKGKMTRLPNWFAKSTAPTRSTCPRGCGGPIRMSATEKQERRPSDRTTFFLSFVFPLSSLRSSFLRPYTAVPSKCAAVAHRRRRWSRFPNAVSSFPPSLFHSTSPPPSVLLFSRLPHLPP